jgi:hypothetical protein
VCTPPVREEGRAHGTRVEDEDGAEAEAEADEEADERRRLMSEEEGRCESEAANAENGPPVSEAACCEEGPRCGATRSVEECTGKTGCALRGGGRRSTADTGADDEAGETRDEEVCVRRRRAATGGERRVGAGENRKREKDVDVGWEACEEGAGWKEWEAPAP